MRIGVGDFWEKELGGAQVAHNNHIVGAEGDIHFNTAIDYSNTERRNITFLLSEI